MRQSLSVLFMLLALVVVGCRGKGAEVETTPQPTPEPARPAAPAEPPARETVPPEPFPTEKPTVRDELTAKAYNDQGVLSTVYFAFDSSELSSSAVATLRTNAEWLEAHATFSVVVSGHCDERGTIEYNLALGERRASSVRDYLTSLGVQRNRVRIVTYGEERPASPGHSEAAWSQNRRAEFELE